MKSTGNEPSIDRFVDNSSDGRETCGFTGRVTHFGQMLKTLRESRALSQAKLAEKAKVTVFTIQRAEQQAHCAMRRSNALAVFQALEATPPKMTKGEAEGYLQAAGLDLGLATPAQAMIARSTEAARLGQNLLRDIEYRDTQLMRQPLVVTAHDIVQDMIDLVGAEQVVVALEAMCAAWSIDPPPRRTDASVNDHGQWRLVQVENKSTPVYVPTSGTPPKAKSVRSKRSSA